MPLEDAALGGTISRLSSGRTLGFPRKASGGHVSTEEVERRMHVDGLTGFTVDPPEVGRRYGGR